MSIQPQVIESLKRGDLALFLGADLPQAVTGVPSRAEMARALARRHGLDERASLARVAQQVGRGGWRREFTVFLREQLQGAQPQPFHQRVVALVREHGVKTIITTAYDDLLQRAFQAAGVPVEVVWKDSQLAVAFQDRPLIIQLYGNPLSRCRKPRRHRGRSPRSLAGSRPRVRARRGEARLAAPHRPLLRLRPQRPGFPPALARGPQPRGRSSPARLRRLARPAGGRDRRLGGSGCGRVG